MIVPQYWAEARIQHREGRKQVTLRRFGWSDKSSAAAQEHAELRVKEALEQWKPGERELHRRDRKIGYNGSEGVPIREEIIQKVGETIVTRNSYGALCLNTPRVFFADIDFGDYHTGRNCAMGCLSMIIAIALSSTRSVPHSITIAILILGISGGFLFEWIRNRIDPPVGRTRRWCRQLIQRHPEWHLRIYKTPMGMRVMATHELMEARSPAVEDAFRALGVDPVYAQMCRKQNCFRARVSPKPWRVGIDHHIRPGRTAWPIPEHRMSDRRAWVAEYEPACEGFASCRFIEDLGSLTVHPEALAVQTLHDHLCRALTELPLA